MIEGKRKINCYKDKSDVYMPFDRFIRKQFDVYGKLLKENSTSERFEYYTSYSKSKRPDIRNYSAFGVFGNFGTFNVEKRDRVKCISGRVGLPMSFQWTSTPYFYPVQIAQFGLQHYSRLLVEPPPRSISIDTDSVAVNSAKQQLSDEIRLEGSSDFLTMKLTQDIDLSVVTFQWLPQSSASSFIFIVEDVDTRDNITINYIFSDVDDCVWSDRSSSATKRPSLNYFYSLGVFSNRSDFSRVIRDLNVDTLKALSLNSQNSKKKDPVGDLASAKTEQYKPVSLVFRGGARIKTPIRQQSTAHKEMFLLTADWLVRNQALNGGWQVPVTRELSGIKKPLKPGWISAMGQGHGLSVLVRAYNLTKDDTYADAAAKALHVFEMEAVDGGVRNHLFGMPWYEEYPTTPPSLVLNGFIYSLVGLYDMSNLLTESGKKAKQLFDAGLESLHVLLPFYDTGRGSTYDLKHATSKVVPNIARPDYHKAHVYLLKWLYIITGEKMFDDFSTRWYNYSIGAHAKING